MTDATLDYARTPPPVAAVQDRMLAGLDRHRWWIFLVIVLLYAAAFNGRWRVNADGALYAALGRSLAEGKGYVYQGEPHTWVEPLLPWVVRYTFEWFGLETFWPAHVLLLFAGLAGLALVYWLFHLHAGRPTAVFVVTVMALCETYFRYPFILFTDIPFFVGVMLFLVGYERMERGVLRCRWLNWLMLAAATLVMVTSRPTFPVFAGSVACAAGWAFVRGRGRLRHVAIVALVIAVAVGFRSVDPRRATLTKSSVAEDKVSYLIFHRTGYMVKRTLGRNLPSMLDEITTESVIGISLGPGLSSVAAVAILWCGVMLFRRRPLWGIFVVATVAQQLIFLPRERYFLPVMPMLIFGIWDGTTCLARRMRPPAGDRLVVAVVGVLVVFNGALVLRFIGEQHGVGAVFRRDQQWENDVRAFAARLPSVVRPGEIVLTDEDARVLHYFSRATVLEPLSRTDLPPGQAAIDAFHRKVDASPAVWAVTRTGKESRHVGPLLAEHGMRLGQAVVVVAPWELHAVTRDPATRPTTTAPGTDAPGATPSPDRE